MARNSRYFRKQAALRNTARMIPRNAMGGARRPRHSSRTVVTGERGYGVYSGYNKDGHHTTPITDFRSPSRWPRTKLRRKEQKMKPIIAAIVLAAAILTAASAQDTKVAEVKSAQV